MAALSEIEKLEARWAENPDGRYFAPLADAYRKAGRVDDAIQVVTQGLAKHPDYLSAHIVLGRCFLEKKDDTQASGAFDKVLSLDAENIIALKSLAEIAERLGKPEDARRWLQRLIGIDAMNTEAAEDLARLGGPLPEEGAAATSEPEPEVLTPSFADLAPEPEPVVPKTLERQAIDVHALRQQMAEERTAEMVPPAVPSPPAEPLPALVAETPAEPAPPVRAEAPTEPMPALDFEPMAFEPPPAHETAAQSPEFMPFDDQLQWGAGERTSRSIHSEDIQEAVEHHEETAAAIDFLGAAAAAHRASVPGMDIPDEAAPVSDWDSPEGAHEVHATSATAQPADGSGPGAAADVPGDQMISLEEPAGLAPGAPTVPVPALSLPEGGPPDLPLIMPEDVTPPEELRRPTPRQIQMVSPVPEPAGQAGEPMLTETMGDLYARQGLKDKAADVYRRLLAARPDDAALQAKLAAIESPPALSASALGGEAVGSWLSRIARASLPAAVAPPPLPAPEGPTPMDQAFAAAEPEAAPAPAPAPEPAPEASVPGQPARPATDAFSLDQIFGASSGAAPGSQSPAAAAQPMGASFDEFFGGAPGTESVRPKEGESGGRASTDDLSAFTTWLHGLKR